MANTQTILDVANIVRHFLENEAQTLKISQGKILKDDDFDRHARKYMQVS